MDLDQVKLVSGLIRTVVETYLTLHRTSIGIDHCSADCPVERHTQAVLAAFDRNIDLATWHVDDLAKLTLILLRFIRTLNEVQERVSSLGYSKLTPDIHAAISKRVEQAKTASQRPGQPDVVELIERITSVMSNDDNFTRKH